MKYRFLFLLSFFLIVNQLSAQDTKNNQKQLSPPDPVDLKISWWKYFESDNDLSSRIDRMITELEGLKNSLDDKTQPLLITRTDRLILSLKTLNDEEKKDVKYEVEHPLFLNTYHLSDWLKVARKIQDIKAKVAKKKLEQEQIKAKKDLLRQDLDILQVEYRVIPDSTKDKLMGGLSIMNNRIQLEVLELLQRRNQKLLAHLDENLNKLLDEKQFAEEHLDLTNLKEIELKEKLEKSHKILNQAELKLLNAEEKQYQEDKTISDLVVLLAKVKVLRAKVQQLFQEIILTYVSALSEDGSFTHEELGEKFSDWQKEIERAQSKVDEWHAIAKTEREQIDNELVPGSETKDGVETSSQEVFLEHYDILQNIQFTMNNTELTLSDIKMVLTKFNELTIEEANYFERFIFGLGHKIEDFGTFISSHLKFTLFRVNDYPVTPWVLLRALIIIFVSIFLGGIILRATKNQARFKKKIGPANLYIIARLVYYFIIILGFIIAFLSIGFDATNFVIIAGALGVGIGFGLQSLVNNFISGLLILFEKNLRVGDIIELEEGHKGRIMSIKMLSSRVRSFEGLDAIVPNSELISKCVVNWTMKDHYRRLNIPFSVSYKADKKEVSKVVLEAIKVVPFTVGEEAKCPKPQVWLTELGENSLNFQLAVWVDFRISQSYNNICSEYLWQIETALREHGIEIPFPQRDIRVKEFPKDR